jgi:ABC transporter DrrB family efflux protein
MMRDKSLVAMVKGRWREFKREPSAMFFVFFMPLLWMVVLGLAFSQKENKTYGIALIKPSFAEVAGEMPPLYPRMLELLRTASQHELLVGDNQQVTTWMQRGKIVLAVEIAGDGSLHYHYDQRNNEASQARAAVNDMLQKALGRREVVENSDSLLSIPGQRYIDFLIPGLLALSMLTTSLYGTGMTIVSHRKENLLKRFRVTPMRPFLYFLSYILGRLYILLLEFLVIMCAGTLLFGFKVSGSWLAYITVCISATAAFTALSILMGSRMNNTSAYNGITNLVMFPMMLAGGIWFSRSGFPDWLGAVVDYFPLTLCVDALRKIALEGGGFAMVSGEILLLGLYTVLCALAAKKVFRWY